MALGGRPKEEGGHKDLKISVNKFVREGLEKVGNKSQFIEKLARPVLEKLDPGEASVFLWRIDIYISQGIIQAAKKGDFKQVNALSWIANSLEDARGLCRLPPSNFKLPQEGLAAQDKFIYDCFEDIDEIRRVDVQHSSAEAMVLLRSLKSKLRSWMKEKLDPDWNEQWNSFVRRHNEDRPTYDDRLMGWQPECGAPEVAFLISKISALLHEALKTGQL